VDDRVEVAVRFGDIECWILGDFAILDLNELPGGENRRVS